MEANADTQTDVHFSAYWIAAMISMSIVVVASTLIILAVAFLEALGVFLAALIALGSLALIIRALRVSMTVESDAVAIHNFLKSYRFSWASMESIVVMKGSWIDDGELIEFRVRGNMRVLAQASLGRRARRERILAAIKPFADAWGISISR